MMSTENIAFFAKTNFRNQDRVFGIKTDDRRRHMYVIGKTGMGKTNLLENLAIQDIQHGYGMAFIDPHGDTAEKLVQAIPAERMHDVIYFNPADQEFPIAFNIMEQVESKYRPLIASGLIGVFKKLWADSWGPRLEYILRNAILALLEYPGSTLLGVNRLLVDKEYRKKVIDNVTDPVVRSFWVDEFTKWNDRVLQEVVSPIQNKVGQFLSNPMIRNIIGQTHTAFDIRDVMDNKKILILNLSKGRIGEDISSLLGALMITKIQLAAMGRVDIEEETRSDFYLYVDEFQNFATESFANILSEARKYHLNLILANQYITQVDEMVRDAIFGNAGTIISFRVGATDAEFLEKEFEPVFMATDIVNLPKYHIYLKLMIDGIAADAFSATSLPPIEIHATKQNTETIIAMSRERYASNQEEVEEKIRRWSGMLSEAERQAIYQLNTAPRPVQTTPAQGRPTQQTPLMRSTARTVTPRERPAPSTQSRTVVQSVPKEVSVSERVSVAAPSIVPPGELTHSVSNEEAAGISQQSNTVTTGAPNEQPERILYTAQCVVCHEEIQVPFQPDGTRPTFCREHLKEYQRLAAKSRAENAAQYVEQVQPPQQSVQSSVSMEERTMVERNPAVSQERGTNDTSQPQPAARQQRQYERKAFASQEKPLSLYQMQHVAPKKFRHAGDVRKKLELESIRGIIRESTKKEE